jgi:Glycosyl hydrolases family 8
MIRKLCPVVVFFLAACSTSQPGGPKPGGETGGAGGSQTTGGRGGSGGSANTGGSGGSGSGGAGGSVTGGSGGAGGSGGGGAGGSGAGGSGGAGGNATGGSGGGAGGATGGGGGTDANPATGGYRFGSRPQQYPMGSIKPTGDQGSLDAAVKAAYDKWKAAYVKPLCGGYVVKTTTTPHPIVNNPTTNSTALGNGMVITAMMAGHDPEAQAIFDGMFAVARKFPSILGSYVPPKHGIGPRANNLNLLAYAIANNCAKAFDDHSEVNGDLIFAYALAVADKQWGSSGKVNYLDELKKTVNAIKQYDMSTLKTPLIGDWSTLPGEGMWTTMAKPQNFMVGSFRVFGKASGDVYWTEVVEAIQTLIADVQTRLSPMTGLFTRYLVGSRNLPNNAVLNGRDINSRDHFGDVGQLPLWIAADYIGSGDMRSKAALTKITTWLKTKTAGDPSKIVDGYRLNGDNIGTTGTMAFVAPFGAIAAFDAGNQAWLDAVWKLMSAAPTTSEVADTANVLGMLMVTGNWWQP